MQKHFVHPKFITIYLRYVVYHFLHLVQQIKASHTIDYATDNPILDMHNRFDPRVEENLQPFNASIDRTGHSNFQLPLSRN